MYRRALRSIQSDLIKQATFHRTSSIFVGTPSKLPTHPASSSRNGDGKQTGNSRLVQADGKNVSRSLVPFKSAKSFYRSLWAACSVRSRSGAEAVLSRMKYEGIEPDQVTMLLVERAGSVSAGLFGEDHSPSPPTAWQRWSICQEDVRTLRDAGIIPPRAIMLDVILQAFKLDLHNEAFNLIVKSEEESSLPMPGWVWLRCLAISTSHHFETGVRNSLSRLKDTQTPLDEGLAISVLNYAFRTSNLPLAHEMVTHLRSLVKIPEEHHVAPLMLTQMELCDFAGFWGTWDIMCSYGIQLPRDVDQKLLDLLLTRPGALSEAVSISSQLPHKADRATIAWTNCILRALVAQGDTEKALMFFGTHPFASMSADIQTYNVLLAGCCRVRDMENSQVLFDQILQARLSSTGETYEHMLGVSLRTGHLDRAFHWVSVARDNGYTPSGSLYAELLQRCIWARDDRAQHVRNAMLTNGYDVSQ